MKAEIIISPISNSSFWPSYVESTIFFSILLVTHKLGSGYELSATQSFTAVSNNFELAIAAAVATFDANSDQALVSTVGPLNEVPMLLGLLYVVKAIGTRRGWKDSEWQWCICFLLQKQNKNTHQRSFF